MEQKERLRYLTEQFIQDSDAYRDLPVPEDVTAQRQVLRSLMNLRMPKPMDPEVLRIQDEYLRERADEKGIISVDELVPVSGNMVLWQGDITRLKADAIVNAANAQMLGCFVPMHNCIDNCIHTAAGIQLRAECAQKMRMLRMKYGDDYEQPTAVPMLTGGYDLPAKHVIHVVGPIVQGPLQEEHERTLAKCYKNVLDLCLQNGFRSVVFCCISTGVFRFPGQRAAEIAVSTVRQWLSRHPEYEIRVVFNVYKDKDLALYREVLGV